MKIRIFSKHEVSSGIMAGAWPRTRPASITEPKDRTFWEDDGKDNDIGLRVVLL